VCDANFSKSARAVNNIFEHFLQSGFQPAFIGFHTPVHGSEFICIQFDCKHKLNIFTVFETPIFEPFYGFLLWLSDESSKGLSFFDAVEHEAPESATRMQ